MTSPSITYRLLLGCLTTSLLLAPQSALAQDMALYFAGSLQEQGTPSDPPLALHRPLETARDIQQARHRVWSAWKSALRAAIPEQGQQLPSLTPLSEAEASSWSLPDEGGMPTIMPLLWGSKGEQPASGYPVYLYLHGSGPKDREWAIGRELAMRFADSPSVYCIPQIPHTGEYYRWWQRSKQSAWERWLKLVQLDERLDHNRLYLFGISEGGYGSQRLGAFYADYLAGIGPMAGGEPLINAPVDNFYATSYAMRTGDKDLMFHRDRFTRLCKEAFEAYARQFPGGYKHHIELLEGKGHSIDYNPMTPHLSQAVRQPYPKTFVWEDFEMDGRHRSGFYNLAVLERPKGDKRVRYIVHIEDNRISLTADLVHYTPLTFSEYWGFGIRYERSFAPATGGQIRLYLSDELVDLSRPITIVVNGRTAYQGLAPLDERYLLGSCATFWDASRLYPAGIDLRY